MRDSHMDFIERWVEYMKTHKDWKKWHTAFINAQFEKNREILKKLSKTAEGRKKIIQLYGMKNVKGYSKLLK